MQLQLQSDASFNYTLLVQQGACITKKQTELLVQTTSAPRSDGDESTLP